MGTDDHLTPAEQVSIRQYVEAILVEREKMATSQWNAHRELHQALELAIGKSEHLREGRDHAQNEWRATVSDLTREYVTRPLHDRLADDVAAIGSRLSNLEGRIYATTAVLLVIIALSGLIEHFIPHG